MVLKNSKWDKQAKTKYLKKHGLIKKPVTVETNQRPKWSSKRSDANTNRSQIILEDSDSEWDSEEDEALLNHYYPQIGKEDLNKEQKEKIKQQILQDLILERSQEEQAIGEVENDERDGIYLGSEENRQKDINLPEKQKLNEFLSKDLIHDKTKRNRKLPKNKFTGDILEEYGLDKYADTVKKDINDYNLAYYLHKQQRNLDKISSSELDGFRIGESSFADDSKVGNKSKHVSRNLSEQEKKENAERAVKSEQNRFYSQIKAKFEASKPGASKNLKVLEINNINENDERQLESLNARLIARKDESANRLDTELDDDINILMGKSDRSIENNNDKETGRRNEPDIGSIDDFLTSLEISKDTPTLLSASNKNKQQKESKESYTNSSQNTVPLPEQDFLDDLIG